MPAQYLLPCECGNTTPIDTSQAGSSVVCACGRKLEVPSLRAIRELAPLGNASEHRKSEWNPAAGLIFVSGLCIVLLGGASAGFNHMHAAQLGNLEPPPAGDVAAWVAEIDDAPTEELFNIWNASRQSGLGDHNLSPFVQARAVAQRYQTYRNTSLIVMAGGLFCAATSILVRRKPVE